MDPSLNLEKLATLIKDIKIPMFTTINEDGTLFSRPMVNQGLDEKSFDGRLWFFSKKDTLKVHAIEHDSHVNLAYSDPQKQRFVSVSGRAFMSEDESLKKELWTPELKSWFPEGIYDPNLVLIYVEIQSADVWDTPPSKLNQAARYVKSAGSGRTYDERGQQHPQ